MFDRLFAKMESSSCGRPGKNSVRLVVICRRCVRGNREMKATDFEDAPKPRILQLEDLSSLRGFVGTLLVLLSGLAKNGAE